MVREMLAAGGSVEVTDRGRVVAVLSPPRSSDGIQRLRELGVTRPGDRTALSKGLEQIALLPEVDLPGALEEQRDSRR
ncbi:MAG: hypothetical protein ACT4OM_09560 [Actinomycetota bacterium]